MVIRLKKIKNQPVIQKDITTNKVIDHLAVSSRSQNRQILIVSFLKCYQNLKKNELLEIVDDDKDLHKFRSTSENQIKSKNSSPIENFKQVQTLLTAL